MYYVTRDQRATRKPESGLNKLLLNLTAPEDEKQNSETVLVLKL